MTWFDGMGSLPDIERLSRLLSKNKSINTRNGVGRTMLNDACSNKSIMIASRLLEMGANVNNADQDGGTPLHDAIEAEVKSSKLELVKLLITYGADVNAVSNYSAPLHFAAYSGDTEIIECLLINGADINNQGRCKTETPLMVALGQENKSAVEILLKKGADVNLQNSSNGKTAIHYAARSLNLEMVQLLIRNHADPCVVSKAGSILHSVIYSDIDRSNTEFIKFIIELGVDVDAQNEDGETALHLITSYGSLEEMSLILDRITNIDTVDEDGKTALQIAKDNNYSEKIKLLSDWSIIKLDRIKSIGTPISV